MASTTDDPSVTGSTLISLIPAIRALCNLLTVSKVPAALIGGVAASLQGQARATEDVDVLLRLDERSLDRFLDLVVAQGFKQRIPDAVAFARHSAVLLLEHETSRVGVDLTISRFSFDSDAIDRARQTSHVPYVPPFVRHAPARKRLWHSNYSGVVGASRRRNIDDRHAWAQPRARGCSQSAGRMVSFRNEVV